MMPFQSVRQFSECLAMIYCGLIIGCLYDLFGLLRRLLPWRPLTHALDLLFCAAAAGIFAAFLFVATRGILNFSVFAGISLGLLLQFWGIKPIIKAGVNACSRLLSRMRRAAPRGTPGSDPNRDTPQKT